MPEKEKSDPNDYSGDDNPDILDYYGHGELGLNYLWDKHLFSLVWRNNLRKDNRGAVKAEWSFPLFSATGIQFSRNLE